MSNDKKYIWKDYFESRMNGDYSKNHKDILRLVDKELMIKYPNEYPYINFNWADISQIYDKYRDAYYGQEKSESKQIMYDGKLVMDGMIDSMLTYSIDEHCNAHGFKEPKNDNAILYTMADVMSSLRYYSFIPHPCIDLDLIQWNKDKDCVFVKLMDGRSTVVKRYGDTKDDIYAAVAYALAKIEFETNSNFKKEVDSCLVILDSKKGKKNGK